MPSSIDATAYGETLLRIRKYHPALTLSEVQDTRDFQKVQKLTDAEDRAVGVARWDAVNLPADPIADIKHFLDKNGDLK